VVVLLLLLFLAMDVSEFDNGGVSGGLVAVAVVSAVAAVDDRDDIQWRWWQGHLMAVAALAATFIGGSAGQQQGGGEM
jgi:hypothetical protein